MQQATHAEERTAEEFESTAAETGRIIRAGTIWTAAAVVAPAAGLGPLVASGWRPSVLPVPLDVAWWAGAVVASAGLALLVWAGCPVLGFRLPDADRQKVFSIRVGVVLNLSGLAVVALAVLLSPPR
ncbi:hypothetical protein [Amnibacterium endophyticum]|uniref:Uncharacterized protein n=1 Tax=Amnibacterium endophyticum TaxID=2109337 RepID=A0ABW4LK87_9MICO